MGVHTLSRRAHVRRKKITLIKAEAKRTNIYSTFAYPGLALPVVGTALAQRGYDVKIYVESIRTWDWDRIADSDLIGITVNSAEVKECYALADRRFALTPAARAKAEAVTRRAGGGRIQRAVVRVARTIADLEQRPDVVPEHVIQAFDLCRTTPGGVRD